MLRPMSRALRAPAVRWVVSTGFFAAAAWLIWHQLATISLSSVLAALAATPPGAVLLSAAFTAASYACLSGTEWVALRALGHRLPWLDAARVAVPAYALTNSAGFSPATGTLFRVRLYGRVGLTGSQAAAVSLVAGMAVTLSGPAAAGWLMLLDPAAFGAVVRGPPWIAVVVGAAMAAIGALWFYAFTPAAPGWLGGGRSTLTRSARVVALVAGLGDWVFSGAALFILMPTAELAIFPTFLAAYIAGSLLSAATGVPGGIGVFEAIVLALSTLFAQVHETAAALLLYRCIYSLGPLAAWGGLILLRAWRRHDTRPAKARPGVSR